MQVPYVIARTKIDMDIKNNLRRKKTAKETLLEVRASCKKAQVAHGLDTKKLPYCVCATPEEIEGYDMPMLLSSTLTTITALRVPVAGGGSK